MAWYIQVREQFIGECFPLELYQGLVQTLGKAIDERVKRFDAFCEKLPVSTKLYQQQMGDSASAALIEQKDQLYRNRKKITDRIQGCLEAINASDPTPFANIIHDKLKTNNSSYLEVIKNLMPEEREVGTRWLQGIVSEVVETVVDLFPAIQ